MLSRNDQPIGFNFNFGDESLFNNLQVIKSSSTPVVNNAFLLLDGSNFLLLDGTDFLLL